MNKLFTFLLTMVLSVMMAHAAVITPTIGITREYSSIESLEGVTFAIVNKDEGKALFGTYNQNLAYDVYSIAFSNANSGYMWRLVSFADDADEEVRDYYRFQLVTPSGDDYYIWGGGCLNSQAATGDCSFILGLNGQNGQDIKNGAVYDVEYVEGLGFSIRNIGTGLYHGANIGAANAEEPTYFTFVEVARTYVPALKELLAEGAAMRKVVTDADAVAAYDAAIARINPDAVASDGYEEAKMVDAALNVLAKALPASVGQDFTRAIVNPSFEDGSIEGWNSYDGGKPANNGNFGAVTGAFFVERWLPNNYTLSDGSFMQTITGLPNGVYRLTAEMQNREQGNDDAAGTGLFLYANGNMAEAVTNNGETIAVESSVIDGTLEIGAVLRNCSGNWICFDNFQLTCLEPLKEITQEIDVQRYPGLGYGMTEVNVDFTEAMKFLGVDEITLDMLRIVNPDSTEISDCTQYDGWFNGEGAATSWGSNTKICVKFFQAIPNGVFEICDTNGADEDGATYTTKWALVANDKKVIYNINVHFEEYVEPTKEEVGSVSYTCEFDVADDYSGATIGVDVDYIAELLGCNSDELVFMGTAGESGTMSSVSTAERGGYWLDADGYVCSYNSNTAYFYIEPYEWNDFSSLHVGQYPNKLEAGATYTSQLYFVNGEKYYTLNLVVVPKSGSNNPNWKEITKEVGWGNLSFNDEPMGYWTLINNDGNPTDTGGLFEFYDGTDAELYQIVELPAGTYKVECQGYYRCGSAWADDPQVFGTYDWQDNAMLQVQNGKFELRYDGFNEFIPNRTFQTPLMPRLFPRQEEQLYRMPEEENAGWDMSDGCYTIDGVDYWGPCSVQGSKVWFDAGLYGPYDDGNGTRYNTVTFYLPETSWVKIGVVKTERRNADAFCVTNFKMYQMNGEASELAILQEEVNDSYKKIEKLANNVEGMLCTLVSNALTAFDNEFGSISELDETGCENALAVLNGIYNDASAAMESCNALNQVLKSMKSLYNSTDYAGKPDFEVAITAANNCVDPDYEGEGDFSFFQTAYDNLLAARTAYLLSQEPVGGAYNFSATINYPFFCNNEYTPTWNEEQGCFMYTDDIEETWVATYRERNTREVMGEHPDWIDIASDVTWSRKGGVTGEWICNHNIWSGWMGTIDNVSIQHGYTAVSAWSENPCGGYQEMRQTITGLPAGYYSMGALFINYGNEPDEGQYVYISAGAEPDDATMEKAQFTHKGEHWWYDDYVNVWRTDDWQSLRTNMVYVGEDGTVTIGSRSNWFYAVTGFQLYYYGETSDLVALVEPTLQKAIDNIETNLEWQGDRAAAYAILATVDLENISDASDCQAALYAIDKANAYVKKASSVVEKWNYGENFIRLADKYDDGVENEIIMTALMTTWEIGEGEDDTYELAIQNDKDYAAYVAYLDYRSSLGNLINEETLAAVIAEQNDYLVNQMVHADEMVRLQETLAQRYTKALFASLGAANASVNNPIDITAFLVNPKFDDGAKGWNGDPTINTGTALEVEYGAAEKWNDNFDVYQTIYSLPAGRYKVECQAFYRDANDASNAYYNWWFNADGEMNWWENSYAKLYANEQETPIVSIASELFTDRSMTAFRDEIWDEEEDIAHWVAISEDAEDLPDYALRYDCVEVKPDDWYWDTPFDDYGDTFYYPNCLWGATRRFAKSPEAYHNEVVTWVEEGGSLQLGIKKYVQINGDWCVFDNFRLFYLGNGDMPQALPGDANCDGTVDIVDVTTLVDFILERNYPTAAQWTNSDVNGDDYIDVVDLTSTVQIILGVYNKPTAGVYSAKARTAVYDALTVDDTDISLENSRDYVGFQMDVTVSDGAQFRGVQLSDRGEDHSVAYRRIGDNTYRIVAYSVAGTAFSGNDGNLLTLDLNNGSVQSISNAVFTDGVKGYTLMAGGGTTGIKAVNFDAVNVKDCFDLTGRRVNHIKKGGVYIVKGEKVLVK